MPMVTLDPGRMARELRRSQDSDEADRIWRGRLWRLFGSWCGCYGLGTAILLSSLAAEGEQTGELLFWLGLCVGNVGGLLCLMFFAVAATERGDL